jgi:hypothetical protein
VLREEELSASTELKYVPQEMLATLQQKPLDRVQAEQQRQAQAGTSRQAMKDLVEASRGVELSYSQQIDPMASDQEEAQPP